MSRWDGVDFGAMTCRAFVELVTEYFEQALDAPTRARFETHAAGCPGCATYLDQMRVSTLALGRVSLDTIAPEARDQVLRAFRAWTSGGSLDDGP